MTAGVLTDVELLVEVIASMERCCGCDPFRDLTDEQRTRAQELLAEVER